MTLEFVVLALQLLLFLAQLLTIYRVLFRRGKRRLIEEIMRDPEARAFIFNELKFEEYLQEQAKRHA